MHTADNSANSLHLSQIKQTNPTKRVESRNSTDCRDELEDSSPLGGVTTAVAGASVVGCGETVGIAVVGALDGAGDLVGWAVGGSVGYTVGTVGGGAGVGAAGTAIEMALTSPAISERNIVFPSKDKAMSATTPRSKGNCQVASRAVSYTHLTLPTICSV